MVDDLNVLVGSQRASRDRIAIDGTRGVKLRLVKSRSTDGRTYNLPNSSEITSLIVRDFDNQEGVKDIVVQTPSKRLQPISELHPLYLPLQYRLIFPYDENGAYINIEPYNQNKSITFMFKYVNKSNDRVTPAFYQSRNTNDGEQIRDEIKVYYDCRYLSAYEAN
ncbi:hypothetical protein ABFS83_13G052400 [Erythranthe nasuta]